MLGLGLDIAHDSATPVWAPTGISLAALLLYGRWLWPAVAVGAFAVNILDSASVPFALIAAAGNTLSVVLAHELILRYGGAGVLERFRQVTRLVLASLVSAVMSAAIGVMGLLVTGALSASDAPYTWWVWWLGDSLGFILVTPMLLTWREAARFTGRDRAIEAVILVTALLVVCVLAFGPRVADAFGGFPLAYATLPFVVWAALRFEQPGAALATLVSSGVALWGAVQLLGPEWQAHEAQTLLHWQLFSIVTGTMALGVASVASDRNRALRALHRYSSSLERQVAARTRDLEEQNARMRSVTLTISHDLRAPIRAIRGYVDVMVEELGQHLGPQGHDYARRVRVATERLDGLIRDLLAYERLAEQPNVVEAVSLSRAFDDAIANLEPAVRARWNQSRAVVPPDLPHVRANRSALVQALKQLLDNAVTFVPAGRAPQIGIGCEERGEHARVWVEDNGIGIPPEHHDRIFRVFERLDPHDPWAGTGIGLAIVKRAIDRMAGRCGLESTPGRGSRFWIELPLVAARSRGSIPAVEPPSPPARAIETGTPHH